MSLKVRIFENELMRAAMGASRIGLCVADASGQIVLLSGNFSSQLGCTDEQLIGENTLSLLVAGLSMPHADQLLALEAPEFSTEAKLEKRHGVVDLLLFQATTIRHVEDGMFRVITLINITSFGISRERLVELRRQLDAVNAAIVITDARDADQAIIYVNQRFEQMTGYSPEETIGRNCRFLHRDNNAQPGLVTLRKAISRQESCQVILVNYRKDGTPFTNELFISPVFDDTGAVTHYIGMQNELSDRLSLPRVPFG